MMTAELLGPLNQDAPPAVRVQQEERNELRRIAALSALDWMSRCEGVDPHALAHAQHWAAIKPLNRPLTAGCGPRDEPQAIREKAVTA